MCDLITVKQGYENVGSVSESVQLQKVPHMSFANSLIEIMYVTHIS